MATDGKRFVFVGYDPSFSIRDWREGCETVRNTLHIIGHDGGIGDTDSYSGMDTLCMVCESDPECCDCEEAADFRYRGHSFKWASRFKARLECGNKAVDDALSDGSWRDPPEGFVITKGWLYPMSNKDWEDMPVFDDEDDRFPVQPGPQVAVIEEVEIDTCYREHYRGDMWVSHKQLKDHYDGDEDLARADLKAIIMELRHIIDGDVREVIWGEFKEDGSIEDAQEGRLTDHICSITGTSHESILDNLPKEYHDLAMAAIGESFTDKTIWQMAREHNCSIKEEQDEAA